MQNAIIINTVHFLTAKAHEASGYRACLSGQCQSGACKTFKRNFLSECITSPPHLAVPTQSRKAQSPPCCMPCPLRDACAGGADSARLCQDTSRPTSLGLFWVLSQQHAAHPRAKGLLLQSPGSQHHIWELFSQAPELISSEELEHQKKDNFKPKPHRDLMSKSASFSPEAI